MRTSLLLLLLALCGSCATPSRSDTGANSPPPAPSDHGNECCNQCRHAASKDAQGQNLDLVSCKDYEATSINGNPALSEACSLWFASHPTFVQDCR